MQQAKDFLEESRDLFERVSTLGDDGLHRVTDFKQWSVETVIRHLHFWNRMALLALEEPAQLKQELAPVLTALETGRSLSGCEADTWPQRGSELIAQWRELYEQLAQAYDRADPSQRCAWVGPSMSARSCITARQMETWAHGQEIYDLLGVDRINTDRIRNIVILGVNTYGWTFQVRQETPPSPQPYLELTAPSGELWTFGEPQEDNRIAGSAEGFAQVVTQTRNVVDTDLDCTGETAVRWMANAQCFYGPPTPPPAPGTRVKRRV